MQQGTLVYFTVQDIPTQFQKDVYIVLIENKKNIEMKMQKINLQYSCNLFIQPKVFYQYKYKIYDKNQYIVQEKEFRNLTFQKYLQNDIWNRKEVSIRIQTTQNAIMKTMKIIANQRQKNLKIIQQVILELKQVKYNDQIYFEQIILADSAMSLLEIEFIFNAQIFETNRKEQRYTQKKTYCYSELKTIGNQSFVEIQDKEFQEMICKKSLPSIAPVTPVNTNKDQYNTDILDKSVKTLLKIYENSLRYYQENQEKKDQQIKQLQLEKLEQEQIVFFNYQDQFQQDEYSEYQRQFRQVVENFKIDVKGKELTIQEQQEKISNQQITIQDLLEKVKSLKKNKGENEEKINNFENQINNYKQELKMKSQALNELEESLKNEKEQNKIITQEKEKFQKQIFVLDNEIKEYQITKEILKEQIEIASAENVKTKNENNKLNVEKQAITNELVFKLNEIDKLLYDKNKQFIFSKQHKVQLKDTRQFLREYKNSLDNQASLMKQSKQILVRLNLKNIENLKSIIGTHKELDIKDDIQNFLNQLGYLELGLNNFLEEKITLEQICNIFQSQVLKNFSCLFQSDRIKQKERTQIEDIQNEVEQIFSVLYKLDQIKDTMPKLQLSQIQLQHQPSVAFSENQNQSSIKNNPIMVKRLHTLR
ncbi:unnamed protein product [Paramecium primaurelia]|uniref:Uncharacterized protein n=1 Tax=Paramecium primaurelia TaxID=5886 RepID=A0A8S1MDM9_PARPR|nr:unnamed protein product [Paramecium primaurelia]